jgi:transposase
MIPIPSGVRVWIATGHTDMRRGMNGLTLQVQQALKRDPHAGDLFVFRGRRGNLVKVHVALRQAAGARQVHLALAGRWRRCHHAGAARLHAGGH